MLVVFVYIDCMSSVTFEEIRKCYPSSFLVLLDYKEKKLPSGKVEVTSAGEVRAFDTGVEMYNSYRELKKQGRSVLFCTPNYRENFVIGQIPSMRVLG